MIRNIVDTTHNRRHGSRQIAIVRNLEAMTMLEIVFAWEPSRGWIPRVRRRSGALPARETTPSNRPLVAMTLGWTELAGETPILEQVVIRLRQYGLRQILGLISEIALGLHGRGTEPASDTHEKQQLLLGERYLDARTMRRVMRVIYRRGGDGDNVRFALFHERQLLNALKIALIVRDDDTAAAAKTNLTPFIEALIMLNDLIETGRDGTALTTAQATIEDANLYVTANTMFSAESSPLREFARAHALYIRPHPALGPPTHVDVPSALERATKMPSATMWAALVAIHSHFEARAAEPPMGGPLVLSRVRYLTSLTRLSPHERAHWIALATSELRTLQQTVRAQFSLATPDYWNVLPFEVRPLVAVDDGIVCLSLPLLRRVVGMSVRHRLLDSGVFSAAEREAFTRTNGALIDAYVQSLLQRTFGAQLIPEPKIKQCAGSAQSCDAIVVTPTAVVLIECKGRSPQQATRHAVSTDAYVNEREKLTRAAASQLNSTIDLMERGAFGAHDLDAGGGRIVIPVVVTMDYPVPESAYHQIIDADLAATPLVEKIRAGRIRPLQFVTLLELEMWESAAECGRSIVEVLETKTARPDSAAVPLHNFLYSSGETFQNTHSDWQRSYYTAAIQDAIRLFEELGWRDRPADDELIETYA